MQSSHRAIAIVGVGAVLPDAPDAPTFWNNVSTGRSSIGEPPTDRWDPALYFDPDPAAADKTYTKIGGWVRSWRWDPLAWKLPIPPRVSAQMDRGQQWAVVAAREALADYGWPARALDPERTAVVLGNAMAGDRHYTTAMRVYLPEYARELEHAPHFSALPPDEREAILRELHARMAVHTPEITEDTMPGELANIIAGRIANLFNFHGPNFVVDAACASAMAAFTAAVEGLEREDYDAVLTGGVDANMSASTFVKFCKIGALSATGSRPYASGADGFVMGEGAALFVLRRLADAERDGDRVYAVIRGIGGSSDGRGKGITAPNPIGQKLAIERAWHDAQLDPATASLIEGHGTSTRVGDVIEAQEIAEVFGGAGARTHSIALGSVKSNIGHLKAASGAAGMLKTALALHHRLLPPSLNFRAPNPDIDFAHAPFYVNTELRQWDGTAGPRRAGVSAFGFGGTNFHVVMEEWDAGRGTRDARDRSESRTHSRPGVPSSASRLPPPAANRGALLIGASTPAAIAERLRGVVAAAERGVAPPSSPPRESDLRAPVRLAIDYGNAEELATKGTRALRALASNEASAWKALRGQGVFLGRGERQKIAFLYTGQGSQYANMLDELRRQEPIVAETFAEADRVMTPILGRPLTSFIFIDQSDPAAVRQLEDDLRQTEITQPAVLATDEAITRLLAAHGVRPDMVMGHSLGEYGALVAAGALSFADALRAVSARGHAMKEVAVADNGRMAAVFAPLEEIERVLAELGTDVVPANINSGRQAVIGGSTAAMERAIAAFRDAGFEVAPLAVSHAFHTAIVAPASEPLRFVLRQLAIRPPTLPIVANVTGRFYPTGSGVEGEIVDMLARQVASPVRFVDGLRTLYDAGARVFVETGPKRALHGFVEDVLGEHEDVTSLFTNYPKLGDIVSFNQALCGLYAAGHGDGVPEAEAPRGVPTPAHGGGEQGHTPTGEPVVITGAAVGLPGAPHVFDDDNVRRLLRGEGFIDVLPTRVRRAILDKHVTRLVKDAEGEPHFETISRPDEVVRLAGRAGAFDLVEEFGFPEERALSLDVTSRLAIAAGIDALRDAGIPLVMHYRGTTTGGRLPDRWMLPESLRDDTGVVFASAFPGYDAFADEMRRYHEDRGRRERLAELREVRARLLPGDGAAVAAADLDRRIHEIEIDLARAPYALDRRLLFRILAMGHSQFAEYIGARGPNTQVNAACASTTQAIAIARDWLATGRCRRAIVIAADDATSDALFEWIGAGFLASGAAATDDVVEEAALPFDRRRHGMLVGMGAAALVLETAAAARERGIRPIAEVLESITLNSAFHGTRLDVEHIAGVMESLVSRAEREWGIDRAAMAPATVFVSHETYTPARGGSAQAEIVALRRVFGAAADRVVIANTKGYTGHAMGAGIEDVLAVKSLETGLVPPVANFREPDPELGALNLARGGSYDVRYALRLGAGFGSQVAMSLLRWVPVPSGTRPSPDQLGFMGRIADEAAWTAWLRLTSGRDAPELEVAKRTLRVKDAAAASAPPPRVVAQPQPSAEPKVEPELEPPVAPQIVTVAEPNAEPIVVMAPPPTDDGVEAKVLAIVAKQTGYPVDMLDPELDLEADLGIDTVKQAEMFAAVRGEWRIPRDEKLRLRDFPTLRHVMQFVRDRAPGLRAAAVAGPVAEPAPVAPAAPAAPVAPVIPEGDLAAALALPRRVPVPVLRPRLSTCQATRVRLDATARVIIMLDRSGVGEVLHAQLAARGVEVLAIDPVLETEVVLQLVAAFGDAGVVTGLYWLPALDAEGAFPVADRAAWHTAVRERVRLLHAVARALDERIGGSGTFLVAGTRLGGQHGFRGAPSRAPLGGAVGGFVKALARERAAMLAKVVDFDRAQEPADVARTLIDETLRDPGAVEIGHSDGHRVTIALEEQPLPFGGGAMRLGKESIFVVTGAAGSIVSAITRDLAAASGGIFYLLDLVPPPDPADPDLARYLLNRESLKDEIGARLEKRGERVTPVLIDRELAKLERARATLNAIQAIEWAGGAARYFSVDLRDPQSVATVMDEIRRKHGRIDVLLHAAGLEISHLLADKSAEEFAAVFDVKADGWYNLWHAVGSMPVGAAIAFSSVAGRFGNAGQTDYSAANELLATTSDSLRATHPETRAIVIDWSAWSDIGMASRGSIPRRMAEAGIDMLPPAAAIPIVRRELESAPGGEVVIAKRLGALVEAPDAAGGLDLAALGGAARGPMLARIESFGVHAGLAVSSVLDPRLQPFLDDHRIDGTAVLPGAMGVEAFAEAASQLFPGWRVAAIEEIRFLAPFKFYRDEPRTVTVRAVYHHDGEDIVAACRLEGTRELPGGPEVTTHFEGRVRLSRVEPPSLVMDLPAGPEPGARTIGAEEIYRVYFHGPAYRVLERAWREGGRIVGEMATELPPNHVPAELPLAFAPRLLELCFQTAGLHEMPTTGSMGLPSRIERVRLLRAMPEARRLFAIVTPDDDGGYAATVIDEQGNVHLAVEGYRTAPLPEPVPADLADVLREAFQTHEMAGVATSAREHHG